MEDEAEGFEVGELIKKKHETFNRYRILEIIRREGERAKLKVRRENEGYKSFETECFAVTMEKIK